MVYQNGPRYLPLISPEAAPFKCLRRRVYNLGKGKLRFLIRHLSPSLNKQVQPTILLSSNLTRLKMSITCLNDMTLDADGTIEIIKEPVSSAHEELLNTSTYISLGKNLTYVEH